jgi:hypothetical protein
MPHDQLLFNFIFIIISFFCPKDHGNNFFSKQFFTSTNLIILGFQEDSILFGFFNLLQFLGCIGVCSTREPKVRVTRYSCYNKIDHHQVLPELEHFFVHMHASTKNSVLGAKQLQDGIKESATNYISQFV